MDTLMQKYVYFAFQSLMYEFLSFQNYKIEQMNKKNSVRQ